MQYLPYIEEGMTMDKFCGAQVENFEVEADMVCAALRIKRQFTGLRFLFSKE